MHDLDALVEILAHHAPRVDRSAVFPVEAMTALREAGYLGLLVPESYGGMGGDLYALRDVATALAGGCLSTALAWAMHCQQVDILLRHGSPALRERLLPLVAAGELYLASVTTGATTGGDLRYAPSGLHHDGHTMTLRRDAPVVTGGRHADGFLITVGEADGNGVTLVYADRAEVGITELGDWDTLGMRGTDSLPLRIEGALPPDNVVGERGRFAEIASDCMVPVGHIAWAACWLGSARSASRGLVRHLVRSTKEGRPGSSPLLQERLARVRVDLELVSGYLGKVIDEVMTVRSAGGRMDTPARQIHLNTLKVAASELTFQAVDRMMQIAGLAVGYRAGSPLERTFRDLRSASLNIANDRLLTINGTLAFADRAVTLL